MFSIVQPPHYRQDLDVAAQMQHFHLSWQQQPWDSDSGQGSRTTSF